MSDVVVIYHGGCTDGFCAAWLLWQYFPDATFIPANYGDQSPDVTGKRVYIVDFSYPRGILLKMEQAAAFLVVLDHHKSAQQDLEGLPFCKFDMTKSGGRLTWDYIHDYIRTDSRPLKETPPWLVRFSEDRDLWLFKLPYSKEINAALRSHPMTFERWQELNSLFPSDLVAQGEAILRDQKMTVDAKVAQSHLVTVAAGLPFQWRACNCTTLVSETAEAIAAETGIGCCWFEMGNGSRVYSLRSSKDSQIDCSLIAKYFGGGGHAGAAGFRLAAGTPHPWSKPEQNNGRITVDIDLLRAAVAAICIGHEFTEAVRERVAAVFNLNGAALKAMEEHVTRKSATLETARQRVQDILQHALRGSYQPTEVTHD